ncbi:hypothetical protein Tco_0914521 [Tanacetum coccineum]
MVGLRGSRKRPYEVEEPRLTEEVTYPAIPQNSLTNAPIILEGTIEGFQVRGIYVDEGSSLKIMYEHCLLGSGFAIVKCRSLYNVILVRTGIRSLRAVGSTTHSMIKFPMANGVATLNTSMEALRECRPIEEMQNS